ncbi:hypothetical protein GCM10027048_27730 [Hymenobacter coalescens]
MDPLLRLVPAVHNALTATPLAWGASAVPVYQHLNTPHAGHYVLLTQPTSVTQSLNPSCRRWSCTVLLDVVTQFAEGQVSTIPAATVADQITARLEGQRLLLPAGWDCGPGTLELQTQLTETGELLALRRLLRLRWDVAYHATAEPAEPGPELPVGVLGGAFPLTLA